MNIWGLSKGLSFIAEEEEEEEEEEENWVKMALQSVIQHPVLCLKEISIGTLTSFGKISCSRLELFGSSSCFLKQPLGVGVSRRNGVRVSGMVDELGKRFRGKELDDDDEDGDATKKVEAEFDNSYPLDSQERREWREKIREVIDKYPETVEEVDPAEKRNTMQKLLADYPLVVEEEDPDWPEDDGWGFSMGQFFDKITIKNVKKDDDDENDDPEDEIVWQDDNYIRPIKDIKSAEWEETVFKDYSPLIILVHNRYRRPKQNEEVRDELEKAVQIIWNCNLPSPRCVAVDAVVEDDLVSALKVSVFPEIIFTKTGKILYREKGTRTADELSKIMAFFYYGAAKPPCLNDIESSNELVPSITRNS